MRKWLTAILLFALAGSATAQSNIAISPCPPTPPPGVATDVCIQTNIWYYNNNGVWTGMAAAGSGGTVTSSPAFDVPYYPITGTTVQGVAINGIQKDSTTGAPAPAVAGTDYLAPPSGTAIQKANSGGALANAVSNTDYQAPVSSSAAVSHQFVTAFTAPNTFSRLQPASTDLSDLPLPYSSGGNACLATTFGTLPGSPGIGTRCSITNANNCTAGTAVTTTGSNFCVVDWNGTQWMPAGGAISSATGGTTNNAAQFDVPYYSSAGTTNVLSGTAITGLQLDSTSGAPAAYGGATCTNQALTALNASGSATCKNLASIDAFPWANAIFSDFRSGI